MFNVILVIAVIILIILFWVMLYDTSRFVVVNYALQSPKIKGKVRAVVLADLHNKQYGKDNELLLNAIDEQKPDIILIAGDILTAHPRKNLKKAISFMEKLSAKYPIYYGNGNHEHRIKLYPQTYGTMAEEYGEALEKMGVEPLVNVRRDMATDFATDKCKGLGKVPDEDRRADLAESNLCVYGAEINRIYYKRFTVPVMEENYMNHILGRPNEEKYNILLMHNPDYFPNGAAWGADLVLAGHVHGGIVRIPGWKGVASPNIRFFPKYDGGKFTEGKSVMILSRGLGVHTIPIRLFNPGELIVLDLEEEK